MPLLDRRSFLNSASAGAAALASAGWSPFSNRAIAQQAVEPLPDFEGPNLILIRFGGGARRRESIDQGGTVYSPYLLHELAPRGTLLADMQIGAKAKDTGHGQGTLNILTGIYDTYEDVDGAFLGEHFEARAPTLFEYLRASFNVPSHQTLIINGEDRTQEEFYTFSNHHLFGARFRSNVLSLYRYKTYLLRRQIAENAGQWSDQQLEQRKQELAEMESLDYRRGDGSGQAEEIQQFWARWRRHYGESGLVNPRGDRLLTELAERAIRELQPKMIMINYNDCDYVHWGNLAHYTRGIAIMDEGIRRIVEAVESNQQYRDNTIFAIVPDCGRDDSKFSAVPCQHHFNTASSREIFALFFGPGVDRGRVVDRPVEQIQVAATVGRLMGFDTDHAQGEPLAEVFA